MAALSLVFDLIANDRASRDLRNVGDAADDTGGRLGKIGKVAGGVALAGVGALGVGLVAAFKGGVEELQGNQVALSQFSATLASTGNVANLSKDGIQALADSIEAKTGTDGAAVVSGAAMLATFTKVRNEAGEGANVFDRATQAGVDLAAKGFGSVEGNAVLLGKALNDPLKGLTALGKQGVTFTAAQKETIKSLVATGDTLGAQKIILAEVEGQVGGSAEAYGKTLPGQLARATAAFDGVKETVVKGALPALNGLLSFVTDTVIPGFGRLADFAGPVFARVGEAVNVFVGALKFGGKGEFDGFLGVVNDIGATISEDFLPVLSRVVDLVKNNLQPILAVLGGVMAGAVLSGAVALASVVGGALVTALGAVAAVLLSPLALLGALGGALVLAYRESETFRDAVEAVVDAFRKALGVFRDRGPIEALSSLFGDLGDIVRDFAPRLGRELAEAGRRLVDWIQPRIAPMIEKIQDFAGALFTFLTDTALPALGRTLGALAEALVAWIGPKIGPLLKALAEFAGRMYTYLAETVLPALADKLADLGGALVDWVGPRIGPLLVELGKLLAGLTGYLIGTALPAIIGKVAEWGIALVAWVVPAAGKLVVALVQLIADTTAYLGGKALTAIKEKAQAFAGAMVEWVLDAGRDLGGAFTRFIAEFGRQAGKVVARARDLGGDVIDGIVGGIRSAGSRLGDAIKEQLDKVPGINFDVKGNQGDGPGSGGVGGGSTLSKVRGIVGAFGASISSTYRTPERNRAVGGSPTSFHMDKNNPAVDIVGTTQQLDAIYARLVQSGPWRELLWRVPNHAPGDNPHIHVAHAGGTVSAGWDRMPGDGPTERTRRLQVGEVVNPGADLREVNDTLLQIKALMLSLPQVMQGNQRAGFV